MADSLLFGITEPDTHTHTHTHLPNYCNHVAHARRGLMNPWLFNLFMDRIMREVKDRLQGSVQLTATTVQVLLFAVEIDMERNLAEMKMVMEKWGMKMHWEKQR